jgi:hypothetical protein
MDQALDLKSRTYDGFSMWSRRLKALLSEA